MVIEFLKFKVVPETRDNYLQQDAAIWTTALAKYPGFLGKEVWINPHDPTEVTFIIRWATKEQWFAIPPEDLATIEQKFSQAVGNTYELIESKEYQIW
ncbi:TIGR03792 family protein [Aliinostoc sp. HNIBRCY26]|uniref:TIGR03792 family protein n=1 Tax=Aliinostoc sp. HNIBRCY26 TaxID=3418997 RepID=UPI003D053492